MRWLLIVYFAAAVVQLGILPRQANAYTDVSWNGAGANTLWSTPGNWSPAGAPTATDRVFFPSYAGGTHYSTLDADRTIASLNVDLPTTGGWHEIDLAGNDLQITQGVELHSLSYSVRLLNGKVQVGSTAQPASLRWGTRPNQGYDGIGLLMSNTQFDAVLTELVVADSAGSVAGGHLLGGQGGVIELGSSTDHGIFVAGRSSLAGTTNSAEVNLANQTAFNAVVDRFVVGESLQGNAFGSVSLAATNHINAEEIIIGVGQNGGGAVFLGKANTLHANRIEIGTGGAHGSLFGNYWPEETTIAIGSAEHPTTFIVGRRDNDDWMATTSAFVNFSHAQVDAHFQDVTVGHYAGGDSGLIDAQVLGGSSGAISIGSAENPANLIVGSSTSAGGQARGTVDLRTQSQFTAHLEDLSVGVQTAGGTKGTVYLAQNNLIEAKNISVGTSNANGWALGQLTLGEQNSIVADTITIGTGEPGIGVPEFGGLSGGRVELVPGGNVQIGSPAQRADLDLGTRQTYSSSSYTGGELDLHAGTATAYFDQITIGGGERGKGKMSSGSDGLIDANQILLAEGKHSSGEFVLNGGTLMAQQILRGEGEAQFRWEAGRLDAREIGVDLVHYSDSVTLVVDGPTVVNGYLNIGGGTIEIDLGHGGHLQVNGTAVVPLEIEILASDGFVPVSGTSYTLIEGIQHSFYAMPIQQRWQLGDYELRFDWTSYGNNPRFDVIAYRYGDANLDNLTDGVDYTVWADNFSKSAWGGYQNGDFTGNGWVDGADYVVWADHFSIAAPTAAISAVPEPSTLWLGIVACMMALGCAYRRKPRST